MKTETKQDIASEIIIVGRLALYMAIGLSAFALVFYIYRYNDIQTDESIYIVEKSDSQASIPSTIRVEGNSKYTHGTSIYDGTIYGEINSQKVTENRQREFENEIKHYLLILFTILSATLIGGRYIYRIIKWVYDNK